MSHTEPLTIAFTDLETAARAWAAACSTSRAMVPGHVRDSLIATRGRDIAAAVLAGSAAAAAEHYADRARGWGGPPPRGLEIGIDAGRAVSIIWRSESHTIELIDTRSDERVAMGVNWDYERDCALVRITTPGPLSDSPRVRAALVEAYASREQQDYDAIMSAAALAGLTEALETSTESAS